MSNTTTFFPTQLGYIPTGYNGTRYNSTITLGRQEGAVWEAIGFGAGARPDDLEYLNINLTNVSGVAPSLTASLSFNVGDIKKIINDNDSLTRPRATAAALTFRFREVLVCDFGQTKKMMIMASEPYTTGAF